MKLLQTLIFAVLTSFCFIVGLYFACMQYPWVDIETLLYQPAKAPSVLLDDEGRELFRFERDKRTLIGFNDLPQSTVQAFVAAEDWGFFEHSGISVKGIARSALVNLMRRRLVQGASTITQQLIRLVFLSRERTFMRKIQEACMALYLERKLSKQQIMELYVNNIYFGRGIYGVEAAAQRFWHKSVKDLTLAESASLAAVAKSARFFSPLNDLDRAAQRRNVVLNSMLRRGFISRSAWQESREQPLKIHDALPGNQIALYYQEWLRQWAERQFGPDALYQQSLRIYTTINRACQEAAQKAFTEGVFELRAASDPLVNGGMIALDVATGAIKATIGGFDFKESQFNRSFQAVRQTGSSFKPFVYTAAIQAGMPFSACEVDEPYEVELPNKTVWKPKNWNSKFSGSMTLARALTYSSNIIAAKVLAQIGCAPVIALARAAGLHRGLAPVPALALGIAEATVEENAAAFNVFAHDGMYVKPFLVSCVKDAQGRKLWSHAHEQRRVAPSKIISQVVSVLRYRMDIFKKYRTHPWKIAAQTIGKTGSTNEAKTLWFVGSTPSLTTAIYLGRDDNQQSAQSKLASKTAYPIWLAFNNAIEHANKYFYVDPSLKSISIDPWTGSILTGTALTTTDAATLYVA